MEDAKEVVSASVDSERLFITLSRIADNFVARFLARSYSFVTIVGIILFAYLALHTPPLPGVDRYLAGVGAQLLQQTMSAQRERQILAPVRSVCRAHLIVGRFAYSGKSALPSRPGLIRESSQPCQASLERTASPPEASSPFGSALLRLMS